MQKVLQRCLHILHPASPNVDNLHNHRSITKIKKLTMIQYYWLIYNLYSNVFSCPTNLLFFYSKIQSKITCCLQCLCLLSLLYFWTVTQSFFIFQDLDPLIWGQLFCKMSLKLGDLLLKNCLSLLQCSYQNSRMVWGFYSCEQMCAGEKW